MDAGRLGACALLWVLLTSGCFAGGSEPAPAPAAAANPDPDSPAAFNDDTGGIAGVVTDEEIQPLSGAVVTIAGFSSLEVVTGESGAFAFSFLPPANYEIVFVADGFVDASVNVTVEAGAVATSSVVLAALPASKPYSSLSIVSGYMNCAHAFVRISTSGSCGVNGGNPTRDQAALRTKDAAGKPTLKFAVFEADWVSGDVLAFNFVDETKKPAQYYYRVRAQSPVRIELEPCGDYRPTGHAKNVMPCTDEEMLGSVFQIKTLYVGKFREVTTFADPVCAQPIPNPATGGNQFSGEEMGCYGVGSAQDLRWTDYVTTFFLEKPLDVAEYSARPDG